MRFPDPGQQAAQRAHQQAMRDAQRAHQQAMQDAQRHHQQNMLHRQRASGPAPKGGFCGGVIAFLVFLVVAAVLAYVVLHVASSPF